MELIEESERCTERRSDGVRQAALEIAAKYRDRLYLMKQALERGDDKTALRYARMLCGLPQASEFIPS
ncbi:MAG: hypothetical protein L0387_02670 [Acidobacteria bacterium]|nr:hypothetical protein [Acidobacteriota bacterium]